jgi:hypothetical protein
MQFQFSANLCVLGGSAVFSFQSNITAETLSYAEREPNCTTT